MGNRVSLTLAGTMIAFAVLLAGCRGPQARRGSTEPPPPVVVAKGPGVVVTTAPPPPVQTGPPAHAPAHGYRRKHAYHYHYYPSAYVYYCPKRGLYWYLRRGEWEVGVSLPADIHVNVGERVSIRMDADAPHVEFEAHKKAHPPGKAKKKDHPDKGKGKGKNK